VIELDALILLCDFGFSFASLREKQTFTQRREEKKKDAKKYRKRFNPSALVVICCLRLVKLI